MMPPMLIATVKSQLRREQVSMMLFEELRDSGWVESVPDKRVTPTSTLWTSQIGDTPGLSHTLFNNTIAYSNPTNPCMWRRKEQPHLDDIIVEANSSWGPPRRTDGQVCPISSSS